MMIKPLAWDSKFFGLTIGSLEVAAEVSLDAVSQALDESVFDVIYVQLETPTSAQLASFSKLAPLFDHKVIFEKMISAYEINSTELILPYRGRTTNALVQLAWASGVQSRFYLDPRFRPHYQRFYKTWLVNSIEGDLADATFVPYANNKQVGFVSTVSDGVVGQIGLLVVDSEHQRQGIASRLLKTAQAWCQQSELDCLRIATQENNMAACRLYEKHGFHIARSIGIYHYWR